MKYFRILALVLCVIILLSAISVSPFGAGGVDLHGARSAFSPDTVMLSSGDFTVTWGLFYFFLHNEASQVTSWFQENVDWTQESPDGSGTLSELLKLYVINQLSQSLPYSYGIDSLNLSLDAEDIKTIDDNIDAAIAEAGSLELFLSNLHFSGFISCEVYRDILMTMSLQNKVPVYLYGDSFDIISDDIAESFAQSAGFMRAKHILLEFPSVESQEELDSAKSEIYTKAEVILDDLTAHLSDADFESYFDSCISEYGEDPGAINSPGGYLFQFNDMVEPFSAACEALDIGQISGIVESPYGYHIIYRLPLDYDNMIPVSYASRGQNVTLRGLAVIDNFNNLLSMWSDSMEDIEQSPELESLDIATLFAWQS